MIIVNEKGSSFIQLSQLIYQEGLGRDLINSAGELKNRMETLSLPTSREMHAAPMQTISYLYEDSGVAIYFNLVFWGPRSSLFMYYFCLIINSFLNRKNNLDICLIKSGHTNSLLTYTGIII